MLIICPKCSAQYEIPEEVPLATGRKLKCSNCQHVFPFLKDKTEEVPVSVPPEDTQQTEIDPVLEEEIKLEPVFAEDTVFQPDDVPQAFVPVEPIPQHENKSVSFIAAFMSALLLFALVAAGLIYRDELFGRWMFGSSKATSKMAIHTPSAQESNTAVPVRQNTIKTVDSYEEVVPQVVSLPQIRFVHFERRQDEVPEIRIEGILENATTSDMQLPEKVRAVAYDRAGRVLFEKEIYLTDRILSAGKTLAFFGTYQPAPEEVQWVDVTF